MNDVFNARVLYYRRLQFFSDQVTVPNYNTKELDDKLEEVKEAIKKAEFKCLRTSGKLRYVRQLSQTQKDGSQMCKICCLAPVKPVMTPCAHLFWYICIYR